MTKNKSFWSIGVILAVLMLILLPTTASAHHPWLNYHWARQSNSFSLQIGNNLSAFWTPYLPGAIADWNQASMLDLHVVDGSTNGQVCAPTRGRVEVCNADYGPTSWLGITRVWTLDGSHITQATVRLNDLPIVGNPAYREEWRTYLLCHEIGHTFGLAHQDENWYNPPLHSCLDLVQDNVITESPHPNQADYDTLEYIYAHLDGFNTFEPFIRLILTFDNSGDNGRDDGQATVGLAGRPNKIVEMSIDPDWGKPISKDSIGRPDIFEQTLANGERVITYVDWTPPVESGLGRRQ